MQLCAMETHIRISRYPKKIVDLKRNHWSDQETSPCPLQDQENGLNIPGKNHFAGCNGSAWPMQNTLISLQDYWRQLSASSTIVARRTANPTAELCCVVAFAYLLSATYIFFKESNTRIYSYSKIVSPNLHVIFWMVTSFNGFRTDLRKTSDLAIVACRHPTTSGNSTLRAPQNTGSRVQRRKYFLWKCWTVVSEVRADPRR